GLPYYDLSKQVSGRSLTAGQATASRTLAFYNPKRLPFTYELVFLAPVNRAPAFTTSPVVSVGVGRAYAYDVDATDPDGDAVTFALRAGPSGLAVDPATGVCTWTPTAAQVGTHTVIARADDGRGGSAEQRFVVSVVDGLPNRPPFFTSTPVVEAN